MMRSMLALVALAVAAPAQTVSIPRSDDPLDFALTLYRKAAALSPGRNALISPFSAREAVGLAYLGARGATADGLAEALRAGRVDDFVAAARAARGEILSADPRKGVEVANSLWLNSRYAFLDSYVAGARDGFDAQTFRRSFSPRTLAETDEWVKTRTHGKITKALDRMDPDDAAVLLNTVYFKGVWKRPFDKKKTKDADFHLASGRVVRRPRMSFAPSDWRRGESESFDYAEDADMQALRLPYDSGRLAMIVVLPSTGTTLAAATSRLDGTWWRALRARMGSRDGTVELPRFAYDSDMTLNDPLIAMGAGAAFDKARADFRGMARADTPLYISRAVQKTRIEVDEAGTVAAAMTAVTMKIGAMMRTPPPPFVFVVDRPFLFAIEDSVTGTLLFVGSVQDPG